MPGRVETSPAPSVGRERVGRALAWCAALAAGVSGLTALLGASQAADVIRVLEVWRGYGLVFFAAVFSLLALWPRSVPALWELAIVNKLALAATGALLLAEDVPDAEIVAIGDGALCVVLLAAYICCRGWTASTSR
ncbi:hypothetical protein [Blastococcus sp. SYSU D00695]